MAASAKETLAKHLLASGEVDSREVAKKLGKTLTEVVNELQPMIEDGLVGNTKANSGFHFCLTEKGTVYAKTLK